MGRRVWIELCKSNAVVTEAYLRAIGDSFLRLGCSVEYTYSAAECPGSKEDVYVVAIAPSVVKLIAKGRNNVVFWAQGVWPEESLERDGSRVRFVARNYVERKALSSAKRVFVVSSTQLCHYESKYSLRLAGKSFVMSCSNESFHPESFFVEGKYESPVFLYAGSLAQYQCADRMLHAFEIAQSVLPKAKLLLYTNQQGEAKQKVTKRGLTNVEIDYVPKDKLTEAIAKAKYGFVIRDNSIVNRVSTPTKISTYIANGIIPVYSPSLVSFNTKAADIQKLSFDEDTFAEKLLATESLQINPKDLLLQYKSYFDKELSYEQKAPLIDSFLSGIVA